MELHLQVSSPSSGGASVSVLATPVATETEQECIPTEVTLGGVLAVSSNDVIPDKDDVTVKSELVSAALVAAVDGERSESRSEETVAPSEQLRSVAVETDPKSERVLLGGEEMVAEEVQSERVLPQTIEIPPPEREEDGEGEVGLGKVEEGAEVAGRQGDGVGGNVLTEREVVLHSSDEVIRSKSGVEWRQPGMEQRPAKDDEEVIRNESAEKVVVELEKGEGDGSLTSTAAQLAAPTAPLLPVMTPVEASPVVSMETQTDTIVATKTPESVLEQMPEVPREVSTATMYPTLTTVSVGEEEEGLEELVPFSEEDLSLLYMNQQLGAREAVEEAFLRESWQEGHALYELLSLYLRALLALAAAQAHLQVRPVGLWVVPSVNGLPRWFMGRPVC